MKTLHFVLLIFLGCALLFCVEATGQTILLNVDRAVDSIPPNKGPNKATYTHAFFRAGFVAGPDEKGARIVYGSSAEFTLGFRKKYKIGNIYSFGWDMQLNTTIFKLKQDSSKVVPNTLINKTERIEVSSLGLGLFNRFNLDPHRGNALGKFIDLGIAGQWDFTVENIVKNDLPNGSKIRSQIKKLPYVTDLQASLVARMGFNKIAFYGNYRLTNMFRPSFHYPELPRLVIGLDLCFGK